MTMTREDSPATAPNPAAQTGAAPATVHVDGDIHPTLMRHQIAERMQDPVHRQQWVEHGHRVPSPPEMTPRVRNGGQRLDARPAEGPPGSSLEMMQEQLLDKYGVNHGILIPLQAATLGVGEPGFTADLCRALNEGVRDLLLDPEPRLYSSICVSHEAPELAAQEIRRCAEDPRFVQVLLPSNALHSLGEPRYWPIFAAAVEAGLPIGVHVGGLPHMGAGWPSFYLEEHVTTGNTMVALAMNMILEGVFEQFPTLQVVLIEGGITWAAPLMWSMDSAYSVLRQDYPKLRRLPSEYFREHYWFTTQPIEESKDPKDVAELYEMTGMTDRIIFSSDYPHWDFDSPALALQHLPADLQRRILQDNGERLYRFNDQKQQEVSR